MVPSATVRDAALRRVRAICLALPETSERSSHGAPTFFVRGKRAFAIVVTDHHSDGRFALWCAAPLGAQRTLVSRDPARFFIPPYVGYLGWVGVMLHGRLRWAEIEGLIEDAYRRVAPATLLRAAGLAAL